jgi:Mg2+-importing ATPase
MRKPADPPAGTAPPKPAFWSQPLDAAFKDQRSGPKGISAREAAARLSTYGANTDVQARHASLLAAVARRFLEPLVLVLLFAAAISAATGDAASAGIIVVIIAVSVALDTVQEGRAARAAEALKKSVALTAEVLRDGRFVTVPAAEVVPGDVFRVRTGDVVPAASPPDRAPRSWPLRWR